MIKKHRAEIIGHSQHRLGKGLLYGKAFDITDLGFRMRVHLYYSPEKTAQESDGLYELQVRQENELARMEEPPDRKLHYDTPQCKVLPDQSFNKAPKNPSLKLWSCLCWVIPYVIIL